MRTTLLIAFVAVLVISCGNKTNKNPDVPAPQTTDTNNICSKIDTVSAKADTVVPQEEKPQEILHVISRCFPITPEDLRRNDSMLREEQVRDSIELAKKNSPEAKRRYDSIQRVEHMRESVDLAN